jgi:hypothetical protein
LIALTVKADKLAVEHEPRRQPAFPLVGRRILFGDRSIPVKLIVVDLLRQNSDDLMKALHESAGAE